MTLCRPSLFAAHALTGAGQEPWIRGDAALRLTFAADLGWPIGPFVVNAHHPSEVSDEQCAFIVVGGASGTDIDGEAWVQLIDPLPGDAPSISRVEVHFDGGPPEEVAVVRAVGDRGAGLATRRSAPFELAAPQIPVLRIRGRCRLVAVRGSRVWRTGNTGVVTLMGLPLSRTDGPVPRYTAVADAEAAAWDRVRAGAPGAFDPNEPGAPGSPEDDERLRVSELVASWDEAVVRRSLEDDVRLDLTVAGAPMAEPTGARLSAMAVTLAASADPGVARWLGLATTLAAPPGPPPWVATVAGIWALPPDHRCCAFLPDPGDDDAVDGLYRMTELDMLPDIARGHADLGMRIVRLVSDAWVLPDAPDPPGPPTLGPGPAPRWVRDAARGDRPVMHFTVRDLHPLGRLAITRTGNGPDLPLQPAIPGLPGRLRPLVAREGGVIADPFGPGTDPDAGASYVAWQSDMFGRWSIAADPPFEQPPAPRPGLPRPEPRWSVLPQAPAADREPWRPDLRVSVEIPAPQPGQPPVRHVSAVVEGGGSADREVGEDGGTVEFVVAGPSLQPCEPSRRIPVSVTFRAGGPGPARTAPGHVAVGDLRPPLPPVLPEVLLFASHPDAGGVSVAAVPLPAGPGIAGHHVEVALESDLARLHGPVHGDRNRRAQAWLAADRRIIGPAFARLTRTPVPVSEGAHAHVLPGDLAQLVVFRLITVGHNGAAPDPVLCPLAVFAVPRDVAPPAPLLHVERTATGAALVVTPLAGAVAASEYRVRRLPPGGDPRGGVVVASGPLGTAEVRVAVPAPLFTAVGYIAEVRGTAEVGASSAPGRWSPPSAPVMWQEIPAGPPDFVTQVIALPDGEGLQLILDEARTPAGLDGYLATVTGREIGILLPDAVEATVPLAPRINPFPPLIAGSGSGVACEALVVTDPIGRSSRSIPVT